MTMAEAKLALKLSQVEKLKELYEEPSRILAKSHAKVAEKIKISKTKNVRNAVLFGTKSPKDTVEQWITDVLPKDFETSALFFVEKKPNKEYEEKFLEGADISDDEKPKMLEELQKFYRDMQNTRSLFQRYNYPVRPGTDTRAFNFEEHLSHIYGLREPLPVAETTGASGAGRLKDLTAEELDERILRLKEHGIVDDNKILLTEYADTILDKAFIRSKVLDELTHTGLYKGPEKEIVEVIDAVLATERPEQIGEDHANVYVAMNRIYTATKDEIEQLSSFVSPTAQQKRRLLIHTTELSVLEKYMGTLDLLAKEATEYTIAENIQWQSVANDDLEIAINKAHYRDAENLGKGAAQGNALVNYLETRPAPVPEEPVDTREHHITIIKNELNIHQTVIHEAEPSELIIDTTAEQHPSVIYSPEKRGHAYGTPTPPVIVVDDNLAIAREVAFELDKDVKKLTQEKSDIQGIHERYVTEAEKRISDLQTANEQYRQATESKIESLMREAEAHKQRADEAVSVYDTYRKEAERQLSEQRDTYENKLQLLKASTAEEKSKYEERIRELDRLTRSQAAEINGYKDIVARFDDRVTKKDEELADLKRQLEEAKRSKSSGREDEEAHDDEKNWLRRNVRDRYGKYIDRTKDWYAVPENREKVHKYARTGGKWALRAGLIYLGADVAHKVVECAFDVAMPTISKFSAIDHVTSYLNQTFGWDLQFCHDSGVIGPGDGGITPGVDPSANIGGGADNLGIGNGDQVIDGNVTVGDGSTFDGPGNDIYGDNNTVDGPGNDTYHETNITINDGPGDDTYIINPTPTYQPPTTPSTPMTVTWNSGMQTGTITGNPPIVCTPSQCTPLDAFLGG